MRTPNRTSRRVALLAAVGLHLLGGRLLLYALHSAQAPPSAGPVMVWLSASALPTPVAPNAATAFTTPTTHAQPRTPAAALPAPPPAPSAPTAKSASNWNLEASRAASDVLAANARDQQGARAMGSLPLSPYHQAPARPSFPWSRQPLGKHFDVDPHSGVISLRTRRCIFALFLILPGFSCDPGHIDPEPGRGDLFDPNYRPQPLELPRSLSERLADPR